jgi:hypothetical protein
VTFRDNSNLTLGENATVVVDRFVFDPDAGVGQAALNSAKGALRLVTGRVSEMPNKDIKVRTSFGSLAVRGTDISGLDPSAAKPAPSWCTTAGSRCEVRDVRRVPTTDDVAAPSSSIRRRKGLTSTRAQAARCLRDCGARLR